MLKRLEFGQAWKKRFIRKEANGKRDYGYRDEDVGQGDQEGAQKRPIVGCYHAGSVGKDKNGRMGAGEYERL
jgi:hypothetical protein